MVGVLPPEPGPGAQPRVAVQHRVALQRLARVRRRPAAEPATGRAERGERRRLRGLPGRHHRARAQVPAPAPAGAAVLPRGGVVPAGEQGVEPAVLALAGAAGGARRAAPTAAAGLDDRRCPGLAGDDAELPRHRQEGPAHRLVPGHGARPRRGRRRAVRAGRAHRPRARAGPRAGDRGGRPRLAAHPREVEPTPAAAPGALLPAPVPQGKATKEKSASPVSPAS